MDYIIVTGSQLAPPSPAVATPGSYEVTPDLVSENVDLILEVKLKLEYDPAFLNLNPNSTAYVKIQSTSGWESDINYVNNGNLLDENVIYTTNFSFTRPFSQLVIGELYYVTLMCGNDIKIYGDESFFKISQNPLPTGSAIDAFCWQTSSYFPDNIIYTTSSQILQYYNNSQTRQKDISGSLFSPIILPFTIEPGDEFRFEGDETKTFMVQGATYIDAAPPFIPNNMLVVSLNGVVSGSNININQYLLRRYIDNASGIILDGNLTTGFEGPYIIKPDFMSTKMKENLEKYIADYTQKGLL
jgi:hypothetical protein